MTYNFAQKYYFDDAFYNDHFVQPALGIVYCTVYGSCTYHLGSLGYAYAYRGYTLEQLVLQAYARVLWQVPTPRGKVRTPRGRLLVECAAPGTIVLAVHYLEPRHMTIWTMHGTEAVCGIFDAITAESAGSCMEPAAKPRLPFRNGATTKVLVGKCRGGL